MPEVDQLNKLITSANRTLSGLGILHRGERTQPALMADATRLYSEMRSYLREHPLSVSDGERLQQTMDRLQAILHFFGKRIHIQWSRVEGSRRCLFCSPSLFEPF